MSDEELPRYPDNDEFTFRVWDDSSDAAYEFVEATNRLTGSTMIERRLKPVEE